MVEEDLAARLADEIRSLAWEACRSERSRFEAFNRLRDEVERKLRKVLPPAGARSLPAAGHETSIPCVPFPEADGSLGDPCKVWLTDCADYTHAITVPRSSLRESGGRNENYRYLAVTAVASNAEGFQARLPSVGEGEPETLWFRHQKF